MRATRKTWYPLEELRAWLGRGAELRIDRVRERAFLRDDDVALIITWTEVRALLGSGILVIADTWHGFTCLQHRSFEISPATGGGSGAPTPEAARMDLA